MIRDEMITGLEQALALLGGPCEEQEGYEASESVRAAIALLTPPTTGKIGAARRWVDGSLSSDRCPRCYHETLAAGLDALAHEPGPWIEIERMRHLADVESAKKDDALTRIVALEEQIRCLTENVAQFSIEVEDKAQRIAALEARLARVREVVKQMPNADACFACRAALVADAGPAEPFPDNRICRPAPYPTCAPPAERFWRVHFERHGWWAAWVDHDGNEGWLTPPDPSAPYRVHFRATRELAEADGRASRLPEHQPADAIPAALPTETTKP